MSGPAVREVRRALGLTQAELAELFGVHEVTVGRWERGELRPSNWQADALEVLRAAPELAAPGLRSEGVPAVRLGRGLAAAANSSATQPTLSRVGARDSAGWAP